MARMVVVEADNQYGVSCIPVWRPIGHYYEKYKVVAVVNKRHTPHYVIIIKNYFQKKGVRDYG